LPSENKPHFNLLCRVYLILAAAKLAKMPAFKQIWAKFQNLYKKDKA
jgi:hypothetical protein